MSISCQTADIAARRARLTFLPFLLVLPFLPCLARLPYLAADFNA
jgi:hypothetical protein